MKDSWCGATRDGRAPVRGGRQVAGAGGLIRAGRAGRAGEKHRAGVFPDAS
jgi:hypothetical protein